MLNRLNKPIRERGEGDGWMPMNEPAPTLTRHDFLLLSMHVSRTCRLHVHGLPARRGRTACGDQLKGLSISAHWWCERECAHRPMAIVDNRFKST